ncbi:acyltransferase [Aliiroseovarius sp. KMU-50]|uniref:Acyltransferase n=1 Tax=Aliiroseovarius salicola TaxID=3009082 RepID=A0ABT4W0V3_9RHOB|nr:acyltransferase [Aliiroseovarius sp. KMU-50]MDA5094141.1 acyltransferase [Aliiroseovarius sp. KMU-50]
MEFKPTLAGLRGIAACSVVIAHMALYGMLPKLPFYGLGSIGVMLFFVLSGYLMASIYLPKKVSIRTMWRFVVARFARIYPLFSLVVVISAVASTSFGVTQFYELSFGDIFSHLSLQDGKFVFWTIVVEMKFYLLFMVFWLFTARVSVYARLAILVGAYIAFFYLPPLSRLSVFGNLQVFILGMIIAHLQHQIPKSLSLFAPAAVALLPIAASFALISDSLANHVIYRSPLAQVTMAFIVATALVRNANEAKILGSKACLKLGDWSFGIYLLHIPVLRASCDLADFMEIGRVWMVLPGFICTIALSALVYWVFENPARKAISGILTKRPGRSLAKGVRQTVG